MRQHINMTTSNNLIENFQYNPGDLEKCSGQGVGEGRHGIYLCLFVMKSQCHSDGHISQGGLVSLFLTMIKSTTERSHEAPACIMDTPQPLNKETEGLDCPQQN